jgi:hypothetical protein
MEWLQTIGFLLMMQSEKYDGGKWFSCQGDPKANTSWSERDLKDVAINGPKWDPKSLNG